MGVPQCNLREICCNQTAGPDTAAVSSTGTGEDALVTLTRLPTFMRAKPRPSTVANGKDLDCGGTSNSTVASAGSTKGLMDKECGATAVSRIQGTDGATSPPPAAVL